MKHNFPRQKKRRGPDLIRVAAVCMVISGILYFYLNIFKPNSIPPALRIGIPHERLNILIIGTDLVYDSASHRALSESGRSDTLILAHIDPSNGKIILLSIPRDTLADIPGYGQMKINTAQALGGPPLAMATVSKFLGIQADSYILFHPSGVIKLIDMLGGMTIYVDKDMNYQDNVGNLHINLKKGWQHLSGLEAQNYLRFRMDPLGDLNRVQRQQGFLGALLRTMARPSTILRAPLLIGLARENIETNIPLKELFRTANLARMIPRGSFETIVLPGTFSTDPSLPCFWIANAEETEKILAQHFNKTSTSRAGEKNFKQISYVSIFNNSGNEGSYIPILKGLANTKYVIANVMNIKREDYAKTHIIAQKGDEKGARELGRILKINDVVVAGSGDLTSDFTIVLCKDYAR